MGNTTLAGSIQYGNKSLSFKIDGEIDKQIIDKKLPTFSNNQQIIGHTTTRDGVVLFTTDDLGMDCIWYINNILRNGYELELLYIRNLGFSKSRPIQVIFNYENKNIQKVYWVDGFNQIRNLNITHNKIEGNSPLIDLPSTTLNFVSTVDFSQPKITSVVGGGTHTAGMIQYAYNLYRLNSSQSKVSPLSELVPLGKGINLGGGELNEIVSQSPIVSITDVDTNYTHIKVYAIKYTSYNELPSISLIDEKELSGSEITIYDDGSIISTLSLEEFIFLGSEPVIPQHIETKDNRLFLANISTREFLLPEDLDFKAYSFPISSTTTTVYNNIKSNEAGIIVGEASSVSSNNFILDTKNDCINLNYDINKYQANSSILGGEGKLIKLSIIQKNLSNLEKYKVLKDREIYRFGIEFFNNLGQKSLPEWIMDYKMPSGNLNDNYNTLKVELKPAFYTWLNNATFENDADRPVGYRIIRADRLEKDKTILFQGLISGMMVNAPRDSKNALLYTLAEKRENSKILPKLPNILFRTFQKVSPLQANSHLLNMQFKNDTPSNVGVTDNHNPLTEIQFDSSAGCETRRKADTYQYTAMFQIYSPEIEFLSSNSNSSTLFRVIGGEVNTSNSYWGKEISVTTKISVKEAKVTNGLSPHVSGANKVNIQGNATELLERGLICDTNGSTPDENIEINQFYRSFNTFVPASNISPYNIYGTPELTQRGQGNTTYNNKPKYIYSNNLEGFLTDGVSERIGNCTQGFEKSGVNSRAIISLNSYGAKCVTFVADRGDDADIEPHNRPLLETLYNNSGINNPNVGLLTEFIIPEKDIYLSNIYGGNSFEDKKRTNYIEIGDYKDINNIFIQIDSAGDTYVGTYSFLRIAKTDKEVYSKGVNQMTEIVSFKVETTVDLINRNDISLSEWDSRFQPRYDEYHKYNRVYSQQPTLIKNRDVEFTFRRISNFDTRVQASKIKIPNESVDNWTDILENEVLDINGKYGPINALVSFNDNLYTFQDEAISALSINPRVQIQSEDGIGLELGTGGILADFQYLSTKSGCNSKWGIISTKKGIYYYDLLNKAIGRIPDATATSLTELKGMRSFFNKNFDYEALKKNNPVLKEGIVFGHDNHNNDIYFTLLQGDKSFTWCYNETYDTFVDLKPGYIPSRYINKGDKLFLVPQNNKQLYQQNRGSYNKFFGQYHPSYIILQINPESDIDCVFDSIHFNSELYLNDIDQPDKTLTHIQAYNEYQNSGRIPLIVGRDKNLRRKFREWKAEIPRMKRNRIRNPWIYLKLELDNTSNYKLILHDIIINYSV